MLFSSETFAKKTKIILSLALKTISWLDNILEYTEFSEKFTINTMKYSLLSSNSFFRLSSDYLNFESGAPSGQKSRNVLLRFVLLNF
jgi:hypothetical protein